MNKPTEGPYRLENASGYVGRRFVFNGARIVGADGSLIAIISRKADRPIDEKAANARLLVKSWEMRKALKRVLSVGLDEGAGYSRQEKAADDLTQDIRALLREIDGDDE